MTPNLFYVPGNTLEHITTIDAPLSLCGKLRVWKDTPKCPEAGRFRNRVCKTCARIRRELPDD